MLTGKETIDYNGSSIGGMVAELVDAPYVSLATKFDLEGTTATVPARSKAVKKWLKYLAGGSELPERCSRTTHPEHARHHGRPHQTAESGRARSIDALTSIVSYELPPAKAGVKLVSPDNVAD
jgi:electron transfer flavoprotein beta subunit